MMRKLDERGVAALEFCLVAVPLFTLMFAIFDLGRYACSHCGRSRMLRLAQI
jgi:Flp pilus assembly protein TadG